MDEALDKSAPTLLSREDFKRKLNIREAMHTPDGRARATTMEANEYIKDLNPNYPYIAEPEDTRLETIHERAEKDKARKSHRDAIKAGAKQGREILMAEVTPERRATNQHYKNKDGPDRRSYEEDVGRESMFKSEEDSEDDPFRKSAQTPIVELIKERRRLR